MKIKSKLFFLGIVIVFLIGSLILVSAKTSNIEDTNKISFIGWLKNLFKFDITGKAVEEGFTDYKTQYNIDNLKELQGQNIQVQEDTETGVLTFQGGVEGSVVKIDGTEYDLSKTNSFLKIDPATGNLKEGKFKVSERYIYGNYPLGDNQLLKDIPSESEIYFSKEKGEFSLSLSENAGDYVGETFEVNNVDFDKGFDFSFDKNQKFLKEIKFTVNDQNPAKMKFLGGEFSLPAGSDFSFKNGIANFPEGTIITKYPESEKLINFPIGEYVGEKWIQKGTLNGQMLISGKNIQLSKELLGTNQDIILESGSLAFQNGKIYVPKGETAKFSNGISVFSKGELASSETYLYFDKSKVSGENYILADNDLFEYKRAPGGRDVEVDFNKNNPWIEMKEEDRFLITSGALGGSGEIEILKQTSDFQPHIKVKGDFVIINDGIRQDIITEAYKISGGKQAREQAIYVKDAGKIYGKNGPQAVLDISLSESEIRGDKPGVRMVCDGDKGACHYWEIFADEGKGYFYADRVKIQGTDAEIKKLINRPDLPGSPRIDHAWKPDTQNLNQALTYQKSIENFQRQSRGAWENQVTNQFGEQQGGIIISRIDEIYRNNDFNTAQQMALNYENDLRNQGILKSQQSIPSIDITNLQNYNNFATAEIGLRNLADDWFAKGWITQEQYNEMLFVGVWGPTEQQQQKSIYYSHRFDHKKINVPWEEVSFFSVR